MFSRQLTICSLLISCVFASVSIEARNTHSQFLQLFKFDIPAQPLTQTLDTYSEITGINFLIDQELTKDIFSNAVVGRFTADSAIQVILCQSGLSASFHQDNILIITKASEIQPEESEKCLNLMPVTTVATDTTTETNKQTDVIATLPLRRKSEIEKISILGTRGPSRTVFDSPVPIDVFSAEEINYIGNTADLTDNLKSLIPSFIATPATGDGSAFIRPTSLRGMSPDQTLIMVNGKRRHRSALVQFLAPAASNGAHGSDIGMIPSIAIKRLEILRDGASAQYGSDAIAGVINLQLKDETDGNEVRWSYGEFYEGESSWIFGANLGTSFGENGFVNLSLETNKNQALSRGLQRPDAQQLIDSGIDGVGDDSPFGDQPLVQSWGRPQTQGAKLMFNMGYQANSWLEWYAHGNVADTEGRYRFFYRPPNHETLLNVTTLPGGYTPYLDGKQKDESIVTGFRGDNDDDLHFDISASWGRNQLDYFLNNTINPGLVDPVLGTPGQRNFDMGGYEQSEFNLNADFSLEVDSDLLLSGGLEWRKESYKTKAGEISAFGILPGPNGLTSVTQERAGTFNRHNFAIYSDIEQKFTDKLLLQYALRYENFSNFGNTTNVKFATRYALTEKVLLRSSLSTGFHAPTPGQANFNTIITTFDGMTGTQVEEGLVPPDHPDAVAAGGAPLQEEESRNFSFGLTQKMGLQSRLALDFYKVFVDGRIYRTSDITTADGRIISFYTNAMDVDHRGVELVFTTHFNLLSDFPTDLTFAYNHSKIDVVSQRKVNGLLPVSDAIIEDIESNYPKDRFIITGVMDLKDNWKLVIRGNFYGDHFDERGRIGDPIEPTAKVRSILFWDMELSYNPTQDLTFTLGSNNLFDQYVNQIGEGYANRLSVGLPYPRRTPANYEGGSWYAKVHYRF